MIKIIVESMAGEGKSTIAMEIADHLESLGFDCIIDDMDEEYTGHHERRLDDILERSPEIIIETKQTIRKSVPDIEDLGFNDYLSPDGLPIQKCLFDGFDKTAPIGIACPCPRCTPRC